MVNAPVLPAYSGANVRGIMPALMTPPSRRDLPSWFPAPLIGADQVVILVLDGLGWDQLQSHRHIAPNLASMVGGPITTVVPSTTSTALTSIVTGLEPAEHGIVGYRIDLSGDVMNVLRWTTAAGDARRRHPPADVQPYPPFLGQNVTVVSKAELSNSAFTAAHLAGVKISGWRVMSNISVHVANCLVKGEPVVYAYYDGIDKVAHEYGFGPFYDSELILADRLVGDILAVLPPGAALGVIADHGQVDVGPRHFPPAKTVLGLTRYQSGEGRFRWLHGRRGGEADLLAAATEAHADVAWVVSKAQVIDEGWLGRQMPGPIASRLGDVALVARDDISFDEPADSGPYELVCRHGSLTAAEMHVPFLGARPR